MPIIAPVDESERSERILTEAERLAENLGLELHVIHVKGMDDLKSEAEDVDDRTIKQRAKSVAEEFASTLAVESRAEGLIGNPKNEIVSYANNVDAEYIVISGRKRSPAGKAIFGSTSQYVILNAQCPVVTVPSEPTT